MPWADRRSGLWALAIFSIAGATYSATAARDILIGDTAEFLTAALTFGVAHPPGYPLLTLLGRLFTWLPVGELPFRANLVAVTCSAGTVTLVFLTARRLGAPKLAAALAALVLAFDPLFWEWSLALEAFPLNNVLAAAVVYFLVSWDAEPGRSAYLILASLCFGLGVANHLTIVCLIPAVLLVLWRRRSCLTAKPRLVVAAAVAGIIGVLPYAYLPWAASHHPYLNWGETTSWKGLVVHFLRRDYGTLSLVAPGAATGTAVQRIAALGASFSWLEVTLIIAGTMGAYRTARSYVCSVLLSLALAGPAFVVLANVDPTVPSVLWVLRRFFLLPHVLVAPLMAFGLVALPRVAQPLTRGNPKLVTMTLSLATVAILVVGAVRNYHTMDQRRNRLVRTFAEDILASVEPRSVLLASGEGVVFPLSYLQAVERRRPDVTVVALGPFRRFDWYLRDLRRRDPTLSVPFERYDPANPASTLRTLLEANPARAFAFVGDPQDDGSLRSYWFFRRGLVSQIEPWRKDISPEAIAAENERLLRGYRVPDAAAIKIRSGEASVLARYAQVATTIGQQYGLVQRREEAAEWYRRALSIDPDYSEARGALAKP